MRRLAVIACGVVLAAHAIAQSDRGALSGTVSYGNGTLVSDAPIQMVHRETGANVRTTSDVSGRYAFKDIPTGLYELSVTMPCCAYERFAVDVTVRAGQTTALPIRLVENLQGQTLGDDPGRNAEMIRRRSKIPPGRVPRLANGKPDFSGVWLANRDRFPEQAAVLPRAEAVAKERRENNNKDAPHTRCLPQGFPVAGAASPFITKFVHMPTLLVMLFEDSPGFRQVFVDGRSHPPDPNPSWMGHSIGTWDGDTLVVDTVGFNDRGWLAGQYPHTERMRTTERYRRVDVGHLEISLTFDDAGTFAEPWHQNLVWDLAPQEELIEFVCENNKAQNMVGR